MKNRPYAYLNYIHHLDLDAFEEAVGFEPLHQGSNSRGEPEDIGKCPLPWDLHKNGDTTGKFAINRERMVYNCFVCGGGSLLDLAMALYGLSEQEAEVWLYQFVGQHEQSNADFLAEIDALLNPSKPVPEEFVFYNEKVLEKWADLSEVEWWLEERGISSEVAARARLGYQADALRMRGRDHYEGPCIYLPHFWGERLVGWQQRWLEGRPKWVPKYTNTSGFPKHETLYGFEDVYMAQEPVIIVESVPTRLFLASLGYPSVATFGSEVTDEQRRLLRYFQQGVVIAPDNDAPGQKWLEDYRSDKTPLAESLSRFIPVKVIDPIGGAGDDLGNLMELGLEDATKIVQALYRDAYYYA